MNIKNQIIKILPLFLLVMLFSCSKQNSKIKIGSTSFVVPNSEISFKPESNEIKKNVIEFLKTTKSSKIKSTRTIYPDVSVQMAAWLFEASANYEMNQNNVIGNEKHHYEFTLTKETSSNLVNGVSLSNQFNELLNIIENETGLTPKLTNVFFLNETPEYVTIGVDVYYGDKETIVFPTTDVNYVIARHYLQLGINEYIMNQYSTGTGNTLSSNYFFTSIAPIIFDYGFAHVGDQYLENKLWISFIDNGSPTSILFKATSFPIYFQNLQDIANGNSSVTQRALVQMTLETDNLTYNSNNELTGSLTYNPVWPFLPRYEGLQMALGTKFFGYYSTY